MASLISELKQLTDDHRIRHDLSFFWGADTSSTDKPEYGYRKALFSYGEITDLDTVFNIIKTVFLEKYHGIDNYKTHLRYLRELSGLMYDDPNIWEKGTAFEAHRRFRAGEASYRQEVRDQLAFLYETLDYKPDNKKWDIVRIIPRNAELARAVLNAKEAIVEDKFELYRISKRILIPQIMTDGLNFNSYAVLCGLSKCLYDDRKYWIKDNEIEDSIIEQYYETMQKNKKEKDALIDKPEKDWGEGNPKVYGR